MRVLTRPSISAASAGTAVGASSIRLRQAAYWLRIGSSLLPGACPTGRTNARIKGWLGRADQTTKIRGMFVHPGQVAEIVKRFPEIARARLVVSGAMANDQMKLLVESAGAEGLAQRVADAVRDVTKLRGDVEVVAPGSLPNDGKVIEDARSYE